MGETMKMYVCNAFSLSMLDRQAQSVALAWRDGVSGAVAPTQRERVPEPLTLDEAQETLRLWARTAAIVSAVGHADTALMLGAELGIPLAQNRVSVKLGAEDRALIGQLVGPRPPEGSITLPEGATFEWWIV